MVRISTRVGRPSAAARIRARRLEPVEHRHPDVHQHDVGPVRAAQLDGLRAVGGLADDLEVARGVDQHAKPARTSAWSSPTATRITARPRPGAVGGGRARDAGSRRPGRSGPGAWHASTAEDRDPLPDPDQPVPAAGPATCPRPAAGPGRGVPSSRTSMRMRLASRPDDDARHRPAVLRTLVSASCTIAVAERSTPAAARRATAGELERTSSPASRTWSTRAAHVGQPRRRLEAARRPRPRSRRSTPSSRRISTSAAAAGRSRSRPGRCRAASGGCR